MAGRPGPLALPVAHGAIHTGRWCTAHALPHLAVTQVAGLAPTGVLSLGWAATCALAGAPHRWTPPPDDPLAGWPVLPRG